MLFVLRRSEVKIRLDQRVSVFSISLAVAALASGAGSFLIEAQFTTPFPADGDPFIDGGGAAGEPGVGVSARFDAFERIAAIEARIGVITDELENEWATGRLITDDNTVEYSEIEARVVANEQAIAALGPLALTNRGGNPVAADTPLTEISDLSERVQKNQQAIQVFQDLVATDPERVIALPLLRNDIESLRTALNSTNSFNRWILGTMGLGFLGLLVPMIPAYIRPPRARAADPEPKKESV